MQNQNNLPTHVRWIDSLKLRCDACDAEKDLVDDLLSTSLLYQRFLSEHAGCTINKPERLASSMTLREHVALQVVTAVLSQQGIPRKTERAIESAVLFADEFLRALSNYPEVLRRLDSAINEIKFADVAKASKRLTIP